MKFRNDLTRRCYEFSLEILKLTDSLPQKRSSWIISDQLIRSATSIGANLIEGGSSCSRAEFKKFNEISLKSANETLYWLSLLNDAKLADHETIAKLEKEAGDLCSMIAAGIIKLKGH